LASFIVTSLDGFSEGPNGEFDWLVPDEEFNNFAARQLDEADTIGFGRVTYEHMAAYWPTELARVNDPAITETGCRGGNPTTSVVGGRAPLGA
jgi:dihydrofolate reductase